jgi:hypothetical protein
MPDQGDMDREFRRRVQDADWPSLTLQLLMFTCSYWVQRGLDAVPRGKTPEDYVKIAVAEVADGVHGYDTEGMTLFKFLCGAVTRVIDREREAAMIHHGTM